MSEAVATYTFLPWLRRGLSTEIVRVDGAGQSAPRADVPIAVEIQAGDESKSPGVNVALLGPGEITGIDPRVVIRTWPVAGAVDGEANLLPLIEFDQADFPWRYTPARPDGNRLRPWITLIVLTDDEIVAYDARAAPPIVTVASAATLPNLTQSWAWAHAQVSGIDPAEEDVATIVQTEPHRVLSRLLCPRRLSPRTAYTAFLVPALERGRRAGLGEPVDDTIDALAPAFAGEASVRLPVYYQWTFHTGDFGDFEHLVRKLRAHRPPAAVGARPMDVSAPGAGLPPAASTPLGMEGALKSAASRSSEWAAADHNRWLTNLQPLLNSGADLLQSGATTPVVAPPLYAGTHAGRDRLEPSRPPPWFQELNADPRLRAAAGLGSRVVQEQQRQLMAGAWDQVEGIVELNQTLRQAQLSVAASSRLHQRYLQGLDDAAVLAVTAPLHGAIIANPHTVQAALTRSPIDRGVLQGQFRRIARPRGPIGKRQGRPRVREASTLLARMNRGVLSAAPPRVVPAEMFTTAKAAAGLVPDWATPSVRAWLERSPQPLRRAAAALLALAVILFLAAGGGAGLSLIAAAAAGAAAGVAQRWARRLGTRAALRDWTLTPQQILATPSGGRLVANIQSSGLHALTPPADTEAIGADAAPALRSAFAAMAAEMAPPAAAAPLVSVDIAKLRDRLVSGLDPRRTISDAYRRRLKGGARLQAELGPALDPVMAAPAFPQPMYEPLRRLSQNWILPGIGEIPSDSVSLLISNQRFVEAYMVGLNHEMSRELRWHEYPTDMRGTYFRQFWDVRGCIAPTGGELDPEALKDIAPIHAWPAESELGAHTSRVPPPNGTHLVMLVKGEVLRRYPNTVVYAVKAELAPAAGEARKRVLGADEMHPVFEGTLDPDISFFGFELTVEAARGHEAADRDQGWFVVLQERPSVLHFGLDVAESFGERLAMWRDFSWGHLVRSADELSVLRHIDLDADLPDTSETQPSGVAWHASRGLGPTGTTAAHIASIVVQAPFRVAIHASDLLPVDVL